MLPASNRAFKLEGLVSFFRNLPTGRFGIEKKLFFFFFIPILVVVIAISSIVYKNSIAVVTNNTSSHMSQVIDNVQGYLSTHINYVQGILSGITINDVIIQEYSDIELKGRIEIYRQKNISLLDSIYIIYSDGTSISTTNINFDNLNPKDFPPYTGAEESDGSIFWTEPYMSEPNACMVVTCARAIRDNEGSFKGVIAIDISMNKFGFGLNSLKFGNNGKVYITDNDGAVISLSHAYDRFFGRSGNIEQSVRDRGLNMDKAGEGVIEHVVIGNEKAAIMYKDFHKFGWKVLGVISESEILESVNKIKTYSLLMLALIIIILILVSLFVTRYFSTPIKSIAEKMNRVREGNLKQKINMKRQDEIGYLANSFNDMTERLTKLISDLVEAENARSKADLKALQAQINPHFLYNTLYSIDFMVCLNKLDSVHPMIVSLIKLLQASIDKTNELITIEEELENLKNYVNIQGARYADKFEMEYDVCPEVLPHKTLKLILQPLVENAIFHGISPKEGNGKITVIAYLKEETIIFEISDDGIGMDDLAANRLLYTTSELHSNGLNSVGVKNVHDRIKLYFGNEWGLMISSQPGKGTKVTVRFPALTEGDAVWEK